MSRADRIERPLDPDQLLLVPLPSPIGFVQLEESLDEIEETAADPSLLFWILAVLTFGLGDTVSSFLAFSAGANELNPIMNWALHLPGPLEGLIGFVFLKTVIMAVLFIIAYVWEGPHRWLIPLLMIVTGVYLTTSNALLYLHLIR